MFATANLRDVTIHIQTLFMCVLRHAILKIDTDLTEASRITMTLQFDLVAWSARRAGSSIATAVRVWSTILNGRHV